MWAHILQYRMFLFISPVWYVVTATYNKHNIFKHQIIVSLIQSCESLRVTQSTEAETDKVNNKFKHMISSYRHNMVCNMEFAVSPWLLWQIQNLLVSKFLSLCHWYTTSFLAVKL